MYIPEYHRPKDDAVAVEFMKANPFAIVVSAAGAAPFATHIPVLVSEAGGRITLRGHIARANSHWNRLEHEPQTLVIFHGPHAYVSPRWYESRNGVPTWNYAAVHASGQARVFSDPERLTEVLLETISAFDPGYLEQWRGLSEDLRTKMLSQIVGVTIAVEKLEAKFKLSQNRSRTDQSRVIEALDRSEDSAAAGVAKLMKDQGLGL